MLQPTVSWGMEAQHLAAWAVALSGEELEPDIAGAILSLSPCWGCVPGLPELLDEAGEHAGTCSWCPEGPSPRSCSLLPGLGGSAGRLPVLE